MIKIIDFDDSFTYNIAQYFFCLGLNVEVIHYQNLERSFSELNNEERKIIVWGPGPGRPEDYSSIFNYCQLLRKNKNIFHLGICLGHQLLMTLDGHKLIRAKKIIHGQNIKLKIPEWGGHFKSCDWGKSMAVQRYNSLAIPLKIKNSTDFYTKDGEIIMTRYDNGISYQFHPESVGTSFPSVFFQSSLDFLYNDMDERITQTHRHLQSADHSTRSSRRNP